MFEERLMATAERCGALIVGIAGVAAGYLFLVSFSGWDPEKSGFFSFSVPDWLHVWLTVSAVVAFVVCIATMLLAVTLETRRIKAINAILARRRRSRLEANALRSERNEPQGMSVRAETELKGGAEEGD